MNQYPVLQGNDLASVIKWIQYVAQQRQQDVQEWQNSQKSLNQAIRNAQVGHFTFNTASASGSTSVITGLTFTPKAVFLMGTYASDAVASFSEGWGDGTNNVSQQILSGNGIANAGIAIAIFADGGDFQAGQLSAFVNGGFTVTWNKTGTPTGNATVSYVALG